MEQGNLMSPSFSFLIFVPQWFGYLLRLKLLVAAHAYYKEKRAKSFPNS